MKPHCYPEHVDIFRNHFKSQPSVDFEAMGTVQAAEHFCCLILSSMINLKWTLVFQMVKGVQLGLSNASWPTKFLQPFAYQRVFPEPSEVRSTPWLSTWPNRTFSPQGLPEMVSAWNGPTTAMSIGWKCCREAAEDYLC